MPHSIFNSWSDNQYFNSFGLNRKINEHFRMGVRLVGSSIPLLVVQINMTYKLIQLYINQQYKLIQYKPTVLKD